MPPDALVLTRKELDPLKCGTRGCLCSKPWAIVSRCCAASLVRAEYDWLTGRLELRCAVCSLMVCTIAVAP
jgi:hypothetical protein